ncbi:MAG: DUF1801 domain-containing protein [Saprospiraceae bacterium]
MANNKTTKTEKSVDEFINEIENEIKRKDCFQIIKLMHSQTGFDAKMWGPSIVGFGTYHYIYESGREGDMPLVCFSPRKSAIVLYIALTEKERTELLQNFGKHKTEKGCIYINKLEEINTDILKKMITASVKNNKAKEPAKKNNGGK